MIRLVVDLTANLIEQDRQHRHAKPHRESARTLAISLAHASGGLDLRLARLACFAQQLDLRPLGYGSFTAFVRERLDWQPSRQRELARLLRSDLNLIKTAVILGQLPVSTAVRAPGQLTPAQQQTWLKARLASPGDLDTAHDPPTALYGEDAMAVRQARELMRLVLGYGVPAPLCDRHIREAWASDEPLAALLALANRDPVRPDLSPARWPDDDAAGGLDPATHLCGPWFQPRDLSHTLSAIQHVQWVRRKRRVALGRVLSQIHHTGRHLAWGHASFEDFVRTELDLSLRQAQRLRKLGRALSCSPALAQAVDAGLPPCRASAIGRLARTATALRRWLSLCPHLLGRELADLSHDAAGTDTDQLARAYQATVDRAPDLVARAMARPHATVTRPTTETGTTETGGLQLGTDDPTKIRVATHPQDPAQRARRKLGPVRVHPDQLAASRWLVKTLMIPRHRGAGRVKNMQHFICQNPECRRRSLRNHAHHDRPRALGGSDRLGNLRCLCKSCHLRLVHGGFLAIECIDDAHVYLFPGRAVVVA